MFEPTQRLDEGALRAIVPRVLAGLVRRGEDFAAAEDAYLRTPHGADRLTLPFTPHPLGIFRLYQRHDS
jgi:hypothetical protein